MRRTKMEVAKKLAKTHFQTDSDMKHVFILEPLSEGDREEPIKLLEVVEGTLERGIEPVAFAPDPARGVEYPVLIVEISPKEYSTLNTNRIQFRDHVWRVGEELPR